MRQAKLERRVVVGGASISFIARIGRYRWTNCSPASLDTFDYLPARAVVVVRTWGLTREWLSGLLSSSNFEALPLCCAQPRRQPPAYLHCAGLAARYVHPRYLCGPCSRAKWFISLRPAYGVHMYALVPVGSRSLTVRPACSGGGRRKKGKGMTRSERTSLQDACRLARCVGVGVCIGCASSPCCTLDGESATCPVCNLGQGREESLSRGGSSGSGRVDLGARRGSDEICPGRALRW